MLIWASSDRRPLNIWNLDWIVGMFGLVCALSLSSAMAPGRASAQSEDQVKAAFLFNFVRYVEWPSEVFDSDKANINICMLDAEAFGSVVSQTVFGKSVGDRKVKVEMLDRMEAVSNCHLLYVGKEAEDAVQEVIAQLGAAPVFTVSDAEGFAKGGGMANFFRADNKIRFEMNPDAAKKARLKISSRLLRLARVVK